MDFLIEQKADILAKDENGKSISHYVVRQSFVGNLHYLMEKQIFDFTAKDKFGHNPLHEAIDKHKIDTALEIARYRPSVIREKNYAGATSIHACAIKECFEK